MFVLGIFYDDKAKTFCRGFATIENLYISLGRSDISEYFDVSEHNLILHLVVHW